MAKKPKLKAYEDTNFEATESIGIVAPKEPNLDGVKLEAINKLKALITAVRSHDAYAAECVANEAQAFIEKTE